MLSMLGLHGRGSSNALELALSLLRRCLKDFDKAWSMRDHVFGRRKNLKINWNGEFSSVALLFGGLEVVFWQVVLGVVLVGYYYLVFLYVPMLHT